MTRRLLPLLLLASCQPPEVVPGLTGARPPPPVLSVTPRHSFNTSFVVLGTAEAGTRVRLFANGVCAGLPLLESSPEEAAAGLTVGAVPASENAVSGQAVSPLGVASDCSAPVVFEQRSAGSTHPLVLATRPPGPSRVATPSLVGRTLAGSRVRVYDGDLCAGAPLRELSPAQLERGMELAARPNAQTWWSGQAFDDGGDVSPCVAVLYLHDDVPPRPPELQSPYPVTPSSDSTIWWSWTTYNYALDGTGLEVFARRDCQPPPEPNASWSAARPDSVTTYSARLVDEAGNASRCVDVYTFVQDPTLPPWIGELFAYRTSNPTTVAIGGEAQSNAQVGIYRGGRCEGAPAVSTAPDRGSVGLNLWVAGVDPSATVLLSAQAQTAVGSSACVPLVVPGVPDGGP